MFDALPMTMGITDREMDYMVVLRISIGAGEMDLVSKGLEWSRPERIKSALVEITPHIDLLWNGKTTSSLAAISNGFSMDALNKTREILAAKIAEPNANLNPGPSFRDTIEALKVIDLAAEKLDLAHEVLASSSAMRE